MASEVTIANRALAKLGEPAIASFSEESEPARLANRTYAELRDELLAQYPWNFAIRRTSLAAEVATPAYEFVRQFILPGDCLRLLQIDGAEVEEWRVENGRILTDLGSPIAIKYVARIENVDSMSAGFREALVARLAMEWAQPLTQREGVQQRMGQLYRVALATARSSDSQEDGPRRQVLTKYEVVRY